MTEHRPIGSESQDETDQLREQVAALQAEVARLKQEAAATRLAANGLAEAERQGLSATEDHLRAAVESTRDYAILMIDLHGCITSWNQGAREMLGWEAADALGRPVAILYPPEDQVKGVAEAEITEARVEGHAEHDGWHLRADGTRIWGTEVVIPMPGSGGEPRGFLKILRDRTAQRREEEERRQLVAELNHRVRNTLAIVQSLVALTARGTTNAGALRAALEARLDALAAVHDLLTRQLWCGAELVELVRVMLAPYTEDERRVRVRGPDLRLRPNAALVLGMALHELASNAAKYGALTVPSGRVEITWSLDRPPDAPGGATLDLLWRERGGPPVELSPARGLGSRLIEDTVTYQLDGDVRLTFEVQGAACRFRLPLSPKLKGA